MATEPSFDWCSFFALFWNVSSGQYGSACSTVASVRTMSKTCFRPQDKGIHCKINVPDTVLFRYGQCSAWWSTNKVTTAASPNASNPSFAHRWASPVSQDGYVQRHASQGTTIEAIRKRFIQVANEDEANYSKFTCISRHGKPGSMVVSVHNRAQHCHLTLVGLPMHVPGDGRPQLLRPQAFNQLCELLSDRLVSGCKWLELALFGSCD